MNKKPSGRTIIKFSSYSAGETINVRNSLTGDFLYHLEKNQSIKIYRETSHKVYYSVLGKYIPFYFDFEIEFEDRKELAVVCSSNYAYPNTSIINKVRQSCRSNNYGFRFYSEKNIRRQPYLSNIKFLYKYAGQIPTVNDYIALYKFFENKRASRLEDLQISFNLQGLEKSIIFTFLFRNIITTDLEKSLNEESIIRCDFVNTSNFNIAGVSV